ncbi:MAG TPA: hypothetical protein VGR73_20530 [Bryobacteraceae bacterium]|nr:hypothetical protein [Bryobacteraceae bacterium]
MRTYKKRVRSLFDFGYPVTRWNRERREASSACWGELADAVVANAALVAQTEAETGRSGRAAIVDFYKNSGVPKSMWDAMAEAVLRSAEEDLGSVARIERAAGIWDERLKDLAAWDALLVPRALA